MPDKVQYLPATWYAPIWPHMKAFAFPGFSDGCLRINVKGRDFGGVVSQNDDDRTCSELAKHLQQLNDAASGQPIVDEVVRTRENPMDSNPKLPDADLIVVWKSCAQDVIESPTFGHFGPVEYRRTGTHTPHGFCIANGPHIEANPNTAQGHVCDLAPSILECLGWPIPNYMNGEPMLAPMMEHN